MQNILGKKLTVSTEIKGAIREGVWSSPLLKKLFREELESLYRIQKMLTMAIPIIIKNASSAELFHSLTSQLAETVLQVDRLEYAFESITERYLVK